MRHIHALALTLLLGPIASCTSSNSSSPMDSGTAGTDPFANANGDSRSLIVLISDIHLGADLSYAECKNNLASLAKFLGEVRAAPKVKELVIAGDLLDEWFVPATTNTYGGKNQTDFVKRIAAANQEVMAAFNGIIKDGKITLTYVPGNHDLTVTAANIDTILPGIHQARDNGLQGLGVHSPAGLPEMAVEHGHRYNFYCAPDPLSNQDIAPGSIMPAGYFFTRIAALHVVQKCTTAIDTLPTVAPNKSGDANQQLLYAYWLVWNSLLKQLPVNNRFDEKIITTDIDGFEGTYAIKDLIPFQLADSGTIDVDLYKGIESSWLQRQTINKVGVEIPTRRAILNAASFVETDSQAIMQYFTNPNSDKRIVVFGHSHDPKILASTNHAGKKSIYANTGTWIDSNPNRTMMNFVVVAPQNKADATSWTHVRLYTYQSGTAVKMASDSLRI